MSNPQLSFSQPRTLNDINSAPLNGSIPDIYVRWSGRDEGVETDRERERQKMEAGIKGGNEIW